MPKMPLMSGESLFQASRMPVVPVRVAVVVAMMPVSICRARLARFFYSGCWGACPALARAKAIFSRLSPRRFSASSWALPSAASNRA